MPRASLAGFGLTIGLPLILVVHFVTVPLGPLIRGFVGGSMIKASPGQATGIGGGTMGLLMALVAAVALSIAGILNISIDGSEEAIVEGQLSPGS